MSGPKIEEFLKDNPGLSGRKSMKGGANPELENALLMFFRQQRALGKPISGSILREKANILQDKLMTKGVLNDDGIDHGDGNLTDGFVSRFNGRLVKRSSHDLT